MEADLKLVPAKCGCDGCYYEDFEDCPWDKNHEACVVDGANMVFVKSKEQNDE